MILSRLYPIADASCFSDTAVLLAFAEELVAGGVTLLQYRNKTGNARQMLDQARELKLRIGVRARLIMNDRADLCLAAGFDGVHVGQDDISPEGARKVIGPKLWRSEEHTSELQSRGHLVCRLLLEKKKKQTKNNKYQ